MAYADDIVTIGRSLASMKESFQLFKEVGLVTNEGNTKYMVAANTELQQTCATERGRHNFERVDSFMYLGSLVNGDNIVSEEITKRLIAANRSYFLLKSKF